MSNIESISCGGTIIHYTNGGVEWLRDGKVVMYKSPDGTYYMYHDENDPINYRVCTNNGQTIYYRNGVIEFYNNNGELLKRIDPNVVHTKKLTWAQVVSQ